MAYEFDGGNKKFNSVEIINTDISKTPLNVKNAAGTSIFKVDTDGATLTVAASLALTGDITLTGALTASGGITFNGSPTLGDAITDAIIIKAPIKSNASTGSNLTIDSTFTQSEFLELRGNVTDWTNIPARDSNETFVMGYFRAESNTDDTTAHLFGVEGWGTANGVGLSQITGVKGWAYAKGDTTDTLGSGYGVQGEFSMDAGRSNTLTITTEAAGVLSRVTSGKVDSYAKIHGFVCRLGDMDGGSRKYGSGLRLLDGVESGTSSLTNVLYTDMAADYFLTVSAADIGAVDETIAGQTVGTINALVKCKFATTDFYLYGYNAGPSA